MLHLLLIILLVVVIWKVASSPGRANPQAIQTGLYRVQIVLAVLGGLLGGVIVVLGAGIGFALIWGAMAVLIWIVSGFLAR
jgi:hypothetical protein